MAPNKVIHAPIVTTNYPNNRRIFIAKGHESSMTNVYLCCIHFGLELASADDPDVPRRLAHPGSARRSPSIARTLPSMAEGILRSGWDRVTDLVGLRAGSSSRTRKPRRWGVRRKRTGAGDQYRVGCVAFKAPSQSRSGLRSPAFASSMIFCAAAVRRGSSSRLCRSATRVISYAMPKRRTVSSSNLWPCKYCLIDMGERWPFALSTEKAPPKRS